MENNNPPPLSLDPAAPPAMPRPPIAGFWRRVLAACIDFTLLGVVGLVLGLFFAERLVHMGGWGRLFGFAIALLYSYLLTAGWEGARRWANARCESE